MEATKGQHNSVRKFGDVYIQKVSWHDLSWKIVDGPNFDPDSLGIASFKNQKDLWKFLKSKIKK